MIKSVALIPWPVSPLMQWGSLRRRTLSSSGHLCPKATPQILNKCLMNIQTGKINDWHFGITSSYAPFPHWQWFWWVESLQRVTSESW
jgi:hypothetical protein